jgi:two-component system LytT family sensor kinase
MKLAARGLAIWAAWTLYAFFSASQTYLSRAYSGRTEFAPALRYAFVDCYPWALLTPLVFWLAGRMVTRRATWWWTLPALFLASIVISAIHLNAFVRLLPLIGYHLNFRAQQNIIVTKLHSDVLTCWTLFGIRHGIEYYRRYRLRELAASQLEARLATAQLEVLKMQLQPHFLFNTLHAISALMYRDVEGADRMVTRLSDFLRLALDSSGVQEVTLKREMEYLDKYLEIEQVRFGERLEVHRAIDPAALDLLVPNLVLQPLVENAVRHGIAPRISGGRIEVRAHAKGGTLTIEVTDDGPGAESVREGVGMSNTRARLEHLYGAAARLDLANLPGGGFRAHLELPAHTEPLHASPDRR